jgi:1-acyl-sn-glycerol-3-phosphate acyltransferase
VGTVRRGKIGFWMRLAEFLVRPMLWLLTKPDWRGQENIPTTGAAILVFNHISYADPFVAAHFVFDRPRELRFLGKASLFRIPVGGYILRQIQQIPVHRHSADAVKALESAIDALNRGEAIVIYPEGTCTKDPDLWPMQGKTGVARLALITGAPVIPIAQWGAQQIHHPITRKLRLRPRTPVIVSAGEPVDLSAFAGQPTSSPDVLREVTDVIMRRLRDDVAVLRGEPAPTGPLLVPPPKPPKATPAAPSPEVSP